MNSPERSEPEITWATIEQACRDAELYRLESLTKEELDQELREAGFDPEAVRRRAQELLEGLERTEPR